jgi:hypothetical protein
MGYMKDLLITVYGGGEDAVEAAKKIFTLGEWISVEERLPEPDTFAIVATKDGVCEALYGLGGIESPNDPPYWMVSGYGEVWPTHWMPLPEPPAN